MVVERVQPCRSDDPRLAHRAAEEVLRPPRLRHELHGSGHERAERAPEALREAERHRVEVPSNLRDRHSERDGSVRNAGAVQVSAETVLARDRHDRLELLERPHATARGVVRGLDDDETGRCLPARSLADRGANLLRCESAGLPW